MAQALSAREQKSMERIISQLAERHGVTEATIRGDLNELIVETIQLAESDPEKKRLLESCPRAGEVPTPEEFILWTSRRVVDRLEK